MRILKKKSKESQITGRGNNPDYSLEPEAELHVPHDLFTYACSKLMRPVACFGQGLAKIQYPAIIGLLLFLGLALPAPAQVRIKDVAQLEGLQETQLIGYGLIVGLENSGDGPRSMFTVHSIVNMLRNLGVFVPEERLRVRNVAAVMVTTQMKPFVKKGNKLDAVVSSLGDARSLEGGNLLVTPLQAVDGIIYATAQGPVSVGGFDVEKTTSQSRQHNHKTTAMLSSGALVQKEILTNELDNKNLRWSLKNPDFSDARNLAKAVNEHFTMPLAHTVDAATVAVAVPSAFQQQNRVVEFIAELEELRMSVGKSAKVVINERTGTIVAGAEVSISEVAISHGGINIKIGDSAAVKGGGNVDPFSAVKYKYENRDKYGNQVRIEEFRPAQNPPSPLPAPLPLEEKDRENNQMVVINATSNVGDLAKALNEMGVGPRDIIAIFQALKQAGALHADLIIM
jgi:flagellar P-ring protein precursor FlgI